MEHNQTVIDNFLSNHLANNERISGANLYEAVKGQLNPELDINEFRAKLRELFDGPLVKYESVRGKNGGIKLSGRTESTPKRVIQVQTNEQSSESNEPGTEEEIVDEGPQLTIYLTPTVRIYKTDHRNWAIQKKTGEMWLSQYYHTKLDDAIKSYIRHALNGHFNMSREKISDLKRLPSMITECENKLFESFKTMMIEKSV